jgi:hypothetical protein
MYSSYFLLHEEPTFAKLLEKGILSNVMEKDLWKEPGGKVCVVLYMPKTEKRFTF